MALKKITSTITINGKNASIDIDDDLAKEIRENPKGILSIIKIFGENAVTFYVDKNLSLRGTAESKFVGIDNSIAGSFPAYCAAIENKIKNRKCDKIATSILRTVCKKDDLKNCDRLSKKELVNAVCKV